MHVKDTILGQFAFIKDKDVKLPICIMFQHLGKTIYVQYPGLKFEFSIRRPV